MLKRIVLSVCAAVAAAVSARAERTITVESMDDESVTVALSENEAPQRMYLLYGQLDRGADFSVWDSKVEIGLMGTEATNVTVALPEGWGDTSTCLRFALAAQPDFADEILEYVVSSGEVVLFDKITGAVYTRTKGSATSLTAGGASTPGAGVLVVRSLTDALDSSMKLPNAGGMLLMIK